MDINTYFTDRRTIRRFADHEVSDKLIADMLAAAAHAPTCGNMQLYSVVVSQDVTVRRALAAEHFNQPAAVGAPVLITFCADLHRVTEWAKLRNAEPGFDNFQMWMQAVLDTALIAQQFTTIAELNGLGTCVLGTTTYRAGQIAKILNLPELVVPVTTLALGVPDEDGDDVGRLPIEAWMHDEVYNNPTPADLDYFYSEKEARSDSQRFVAENNKQTLAQVFTDVRYPKLVSEASSTDYLKVIKDAGIKLNFD